MYWLQVQPTDPPLTPKGPLHREGGLLCAAMVSVPGFPLHPDVFSSDLAFVVRDYPREAANLILATAYRVGH